jgi:hypothetical protein
MNWAGMNGVKRLRTHVNGLPCRLFFVGYECAEQHDMGECIYRLWNQGNSEGCDESVISSGIAS